MKNNVIIIAEAGVNHNGSLELAKHLIDRAVEAGADYVKFQTFKTELSISKNAPKAAYQVKNTGVEESQYEMVKKLELSESDHHELIAYCEEKKIAFFSTPFDLDSIDLLSSLGVKIGKIPSGEITNLPYLRKMAQHFEKLIVSTGMATMEEIGETLRILQQEGKSISDIVVLHCTSEYPTPFSEVNLLAMKEIGNRFQVAIGYSDHTEGIEIPVAAVTLGAQVIEKHFTLDKSMPGPDHAASLEPQELTAMVKAIRNVEQALGNGIKIPSPSEERNKLVARKSIVAAVAISRGEVLTEKNLTVKRPGTGISPMNWDNVIGKTAIKDFEADEPITL